MLGTLFVTVVGWDNGLAGTPPMGWCVWNARHRNFTEDVFYSTANQMASNGLQLAGYDRVNVDGGWWEGADTGTIVRNATGFPQWNKAKFPRGLSALIDHVHSLGLKWGHYTDAGKHACNGDKPMSEGYEFQDAALFAEWGADMLKVDACGDVEDHTVIVPRWRKAIEATNRPILLSNCHNGCQTDARNRPNKTRPDYTPDWLPDDICRMNANMWRSSADIHFEWSSFLYNFDSLKGRGHYGKPGAWNDPDFLELGLGEFAYDPADPVTLDKNRAHFAAWAITSAPLILGFDMPAPKALMDIVTNRLAISVNQQYAGDAGDFLRPSPHDPSLEFWAKPLPAGGAAALFINRNDTRAAKPMSYQLIELDGLPAGAHRCTATDVWSGATRRVGPTVESAALGPFAAQFLVFTACDV
jgi:alpha-galactosidase